MMNFREFYEIYTKNKKRYYRELEKAEHKPKTGRRKKSKKE